MTKEEHDKEWQYAFDEVLGNLVGAGVPTESQIAYAKQWASAHLDRIEAQERKDNQCNAR